MKKERKKMRKTKIRKMLCGGMIIMSMAAMLVACGANKWVGVYGGTSSSGSKIEITVNKDGTVEYNDDGDVEKGTWKENEHSIELDFYGAVSSSSEPLIVTMSSDENVITVESDSSHWNADIYQRR